MLLVPSPPQSWAAREVASWVQSAAHMLEGPGSVPGTTEQRSGLSLSQTAMSLKGYFFLKLIYWGLGGSGAPCLLHIVQHIRSGVQIPAPPP